MRVQVTGRHMDVGEALRSRITEEVEQSVAKFHGRATDAVITVGKNGGVGVEVDCVVHLSSGMTLQAQGHASEAHAAFGEALQKLSKRVMRHMKRLRAHHGVNKSPLPAESASAYVLAPFADSEEMEGAEDALERGDGAGAPLVIAETQASVKTLPVAMAVLQLELADAPALLFRNAGHGGLNMVYRRPDGNIGWVDPGGTELT